jgi:hypothetical protein
MNLDLGEGGVIGPLSIHAYGKNDRSYANGFPFAVVSNPEIGIRTSCASQLSRDGPDPASTGNKATRAGHPDLTLRVGWGRAGRLTGVQVDFPCHA